MGADDLLNRAYAVPTANLVFSQSLAWRILSVTLLACEMSGIVWEFEHSLALPFFGIGMKTDLFQLWPLLSFPDLLAY